MFYPLAYSKMIHWLRVAVWGACEQWSLPWSLISFPGASGMTSGFGSLPGVMVCFVRLVYLMIRTQVPPWRREPHVYLFQGIVLVLTQVVSEWFSFCF